MNRYVVSLGSNHCKEKNILFAKEKIENLFFDVAFTRFINTEPIDFDTSESFLNGLVIFKSELNLRQTRNLLKEIERLSGRTNEDKVRGIIKLDLDVIIFNDEIIKKTDFEREYVKLLLNDLGLKLNYV